MVVFNIDVKIRESGSDEIKSGLKALQKTADRTSKQIAGIGKRIRTDKVKKFNKELKKTGETGKTVRRIMTQLFGAIGIGLAIREIVQLSDVFQNFQNRLGIVERHTANLATTTERLFDISNRTRSAFSATAELFTRVSIATKNLGRSQGELLRFTETLNKAVILSGTTAAEAKNGIIQLSQALASGSLRGDELRSVLEQLPAVADAISTSMGITRGELRKMGEAGKISANIIIDAMLEASERIDKNFATTIPTISQAFTVLGNEMTKVIGNFNKSTGAAQGLSLSIIGASKFLVPLAQSLTIAALAWAAVTIQMKITAAAAGQTAIAMFRATLAAHPFAIALIAIGTVTAFATHALVEYTDEVSKLERISLAKSPLELLEEKISSAGAVLENIQKQFERTGNSSDALVKQIAKQTRSLRILQNQMRMMGGESSDMIEENIKLDKSVKDVIARLEEENRTMRDLTVSRKNGIKALKIMRKLEKKTGGEDDDDATHRRTIERQLELISASKRYREALIGVKEPLKSLQQDMRAFDEATRGLNKSSSEVVLEWLKLANIPDLNLGGKFGGTALRAEIDKTIVKMRILRATPEQIAIALSGLITTGISGFETMGQKVRTLNALIAEGGHKARGARAAFKALLGRTEDEEFLDQLDVLLAKLRAGVLVGAEFRAEVRKLGPEGKKAGTDFGDGISAGFKRLHDEANDLKKVGEEIVELFANKMVEAIHTLATEGSLDFKAFATDILKQIAKIIIRLLIIKALSALTGGNAELVKVGADAAIAESHKSDARAQGGPVEAGRPYLVGENGPEVVVPDQSGRVISNANLQSAPNPPPIVNVTVVNVIDPDEQEAAINSGDLDQAIINVLARNGDQGRQALQQS